MFGPFLESLESRALFSVSTGIAPAAVAPSAASASLQPLVVADKTAPTSKLGVTAVTAAGAKLYTFTVTYADPSKVKRASLGAGDLVVTGPGGFKATAKFVSAVPGANAASIKATYTIVPPGGTWNAADNGTYTVKLQAKQIADAKGNTNAVARTVGTFKVNIASSVIPSILGTYNGILDIPNVGHYKNAALVIKTQSATGAYTGTLTASGSIAVKVSGKVSASRALTVTVAPLTAGHPGGTITGSGTGTVNATGKVIALKINFNAGGSTAPGTVSGTKV